MTLENLKKLHAHYLKHGMNKQAANIAQYLPAKPVDEKPKKKK